jgi:hypothetical protein
VKAFEQLREERNKMLQLQLLHTVLIHRMYQLDPTKATLLTVWKAFFKVIYKGESISLLRIIRIKSES